MTEHRTFELEDILAILPHRPPFLFVDLVTRLVVDKLIIAERTIRDDEPFFAGHFPHKHVMPGVLVTDALAQASGLLWGFSRKAAGGVSTSPTEGVPPASAPRMFYFASANMKFLNPSFPGETLSRSPRAKPALVHCSAIRWKRTWEERLLPRGPLHWP